MELKNLSKEDIEKIYEDERSDELFDFLDKNEVDGVEIEIRDLQKDENGNLYYPVEYESKYSSYCDADTGYNIVDESWFEWTDYKKLEILNLC